MTALYNTESRGLYGCNESEVFFPKLWMHLLCWIKMCYSLMIKCALCHRALVKCAENESQYHIMDLKSDHFDIFLCRVEEETRCGYVLASLKPAVSAHKTGMTSHPLKIAASVGIWRWGDETSVTPKKLSCHKNRTHHLVILPGREEISNQVKAHCPVSD